MLHEAACPKQLCFSGSGIAQNSLSLQLKPPQAPDGSQLFVDCSHVAASPTHFLIATAGRSHRCGLCVEAGIARFSVTTKINEKSANGPGNRM